MSHFNLKSLTFYGVMIGSVLVLFNIVSVYGESSLKAPPNIAGNYLLENLNLPDCLKSEKLSLTIAQSGIYLTGRLTTESQTIKLNGLLENITTESVTTRSRPFSLMGKTNKLGNCPRNPTSNPISAQNPRWTNAVVKPQIQFHRNPSKLTRQPKINSLGHFDL